MEARNYHFEVPGGKEEFFRWGHSQRCLPGGGKLTFPLRGVSAPQERARAYTSCPGPSGLPQRAHALRESHDSWAVSSPASSVTSLNMLPHFFLFFFLR